MAKKKTAADEAAELIPYIAADLRHLATPIETLKEDPENARLHPEENLVTIMRSLTDFGQDQPVVVRKDTRVVVKGNGRLAAARRLGWKFLAAVMVDESEIKAAARAIADNRSGELAKWDDAVLARLIQRVQESTDVPVEATGFTAEQAANILTAVAASGPPDGSGAAGGAVPEAEPLRVSLMDRFVVPPFSVLDARQGYWQERKRAWLALGIQSEIGRGNNNVAMTHTFTTENMNFYTLKERLEEELGRTLTTAEAGEILKQRGVLVDPRADQRTRIDACRRREANAAPGGSPRPAMKLNAEGKTERGDGAGRPLAETFGSGAPGTMDAQRKQWREEGRPAGGETANLQGGLTMRTSMHPYGGGQSPVGQSGTSIFDPVLCEIAYRWFCPPGGSVLDPFAGGSVRGIVAGRLGRYYTGIDLRPEQIAANEEQAARLVSNLRPRWIAGDARAAAALAPGEYDLIFSCPPYGDLEQYSYDARDLSCMEHADFLDAYRACILAACAMLKPDRFALFVVGDFRDHEAGAYRNFPAETTAIFRAAGLALYNEAVLLTAVGSLPIRVGQQFSVSRKLGKMHQNVLVYVKGDPRKATAAIGEVEAGTVGGPDAAAELRPTAENPAGPVLGGEV